MSRVRPYVGFALGGSAVAYLSAMLYEQHCYGHRSRKRDDPQRAVLALLALNGLVFLGWQLSPSRPIMYRHFVHSIHSPPHTLLTAAFSHQTFFHLALNMVALYSFGPILADWMGVPQFLAFYVSAALGSNLTSHLCRLRMKSQVPSLGASGAVFGVLGGVTAADGDRVRVGAIFLPALHLPLSTALPVLIAIDAVGLARGWMVLDHAAHLGGAALGWIGYRYSQLGWKHRKQVLHRMLLNK